MENINPIEQQQNQTENSFWCHTCSKSFNIDSSELDNFDYACIYCKNEFLEEISNEDDPRNFVPFENQPTDQNNENLTNQQNNSQNLQNSTINQQNNLNSNTNSGDNFQNLQNSQNSQPNLLTNILQNFLGNNHQQQSSNIHIPSNDNNNTQTNQTQNQNIQPPNSNQNPNIANSNPQQPPQPPQRGIFHIIQTTFNLGTPNTIISSGQINNPNGNNSNPPNISNILQQVLNMVGN